jgi:hypothetical protein
VIIFSCNIDVLIELLKRNTKKDVCVACKIKLRSLAMFVERIGLESDDFLLDLIKVVAVLFIPFAIGFFLSAIIVSDIELAISLDGVFAAIATIGAGCIGYYGGSKSSDVYKALSYEVAKKESIISLDAMIEMNSIIIYVDDWVSQCAEEVIKDLNVEYIPKVNRLSFVENVYDHASKVMSNITFNNSDRYVYDACVMMFNCKSLKKSIDNECAIIRTMDRYFDGTVMIDEEGKLKILKVRLQNFQNILSKIKIARQFGEDAVRSAFQAEEII